MLHYKIAGINFGIIHNQSVGFEKLKPFKSVNTEQPDIEIKFQSSGCLDAPKFVTFQNDYLSLSTEIKNNVVNTYFYLNDTTRTEYKIEAKCNWSDVTILYNDNDENVEEAFCSFLGSFIISNIILYHSGIVLHASAISCMGKGIVFTAPSGTGKSTHAAMWEKFHSAMILNDDCPVIKFENDKAYVYGTPWSGSKGIFLPSGSPLSAIVILEKSTVNSICKLTIGEAIPLFLPRIFLPYQNAGIMESALGHAENIIKNIPIYLLKCMPDREAMELVYQCIM